ncbi:MAG TPA: protein-L-isoaspartate(D-aspartate) O-methyltransferase [Opitutaceae bacterium]|jgi:protein-L-isoaspartate(D-aspartate) O-methyltransferase|nr:protein-L-isoaspartate(D-aspartate) O-methyltransferase [Opitutaceae bacterium]
MTGHEIPADVARAMRAVPREQFVPRDQLSQVHKDEPLPIGHDQTISQPSLVAFMTAQLALTPLSRVLEIGTGSGYQTAILAELAGEVFSIERIPELAAAAKQRLAMLGYKNVALRIDDGVHGWPEAVPFDAIILTAAVQEIPHRLLAQLRINGRLVAPEGESNESQALLLIEKSPTGDIRRFDLGAVRFVPLVSEDTP